MIYIIASLTFFGFVYPGSKYFLSNGLSTVEFCLLFLLFRSAIQLLIGGFNRQLLKKKFNLFSYYIGAGLIGAGMNFFEFKGIEAGLPIGINAFIVFCHPIAGIAIRRIFQQRALKDLDFIRVAFSVGGAFLLVNPDLTSLGRNNFPVSLILYPLLGCLFFSLWILFSEKAVNNDQQAFSFSFYYDFFSFLILLLAFTSTKAVGIENIYRISIWLQEGSNFVLMLIYSLIAGVLPNLLFYMGVKRSDGVTASFIILLEPVIATSLSVWLFSEPLQPNFYAGGLLIIASNVIPLATDLFKKARLTEEQRS